MAQTPIALIVGLGNPGDEYRGTRHNAGFDFVDRLAAAREARFTHQARFFGETARITTPAGDVWLLKPSTYMNLSGQAVQPMAAYYKIPTDGILVVHDELDLAPGTMRLKLGGGNAGHNGLKSITERLATPQFWRLRIGVGHPRNLCPGMAVIDWVLGRPTAEQREGIDTCLAGALRAVDNLALGKFDMAERTIGKFAHPPKAKAEAGEAAPAPGAEKA